MISICFGPGSVSPQISSCLLVCFSRKQNQRGITPTGGVSSMLAVFWPGLSNESYQWATGGP